MRRSVLHKTPNWLIEVPSQPGLNEALVSLGVLDAEGGLERGIAAHLVQKQCCTKAYLRGVFMGSGFVSDPQGDFHLEMTCVSQQMTDDVIELMGRWGIVGKSTTRRNSNIVYLKSGSAIKDFLALVGAHRAALEMESARVFKSVRNDVNRKVNAEIANQAKTSAASLEQIRVIRRVLKRRDIRELPEALQDYIRLRVTHPDATLRELGQLTDPPLSKSAIYHRVRRLEELANQLDPR
jgi:DNA-binding protein WhiA